MRTPKNGKGKRHFTKYSNLTIWNEDDVDENGDEKKVEKEAGDGEVLKRRVYGQFCS